MEATLAALRVITDAPPGVRLDPFHVWCAFCKAQVSVVDKQWGEHVNGSKHKRAMWDKKKDTLKETFDPPPERVVRKRGLAVDK